jgi:hypothetical protein
LTVRLVDHNGVGIAGGTVRWADGSWHSVGVTGPDGTLTFIPGDWKKIAITYHQGTVYKYPGDTLTWKTMQAKIRLVDHTGFAGISGASMAQGGGYWDPIPGVTNADGSIYWEIFPDKDYKFRVTFHGASLDNWFPISQMDNTALFQTGSVNSASGTCTSYAQGTWLPFLQGIELLPGSSWHFRFSDGFPMTYYSVISGKVNSIH